eukprot:CAMPEP_0202477956 /NCGR_PEP_ID=MMETSP1360-20130828/94209_1 /ASSEMBLY_ACC=CAM_ASM_000848 /TAXON_ID=515479 /ORGANISM="Licmophora paradoxa, Strain CCMP2313" /LENGTH=164 /DNA_ID=CAMNT_0049105215 /DNA_START=452 /DNA_END=943 /DNA_ORIENTATION=+
MGLVKYYEKFQIAVKVAESCGMTFGHFNKQILLAMGELKMAGNFTENQAEVKQKSRDLYLGTAFILMSDGQRTSPLIDHLQNQYLEKSAGGGTMNESWPKLLVDAYHRLLNWQGQTKARDPILSSGHIAFATTGDKDKEQVHGNETVNTIRGSGKKDKSHIQCW